MHTTNSPIIRFGLGLGCLVMLLGCPISAYAIGKLMIEAHATSQWPTTQGVLEKVAIRKLPVRGYQPDVVYRYEVEGNTLRGTRLFTVSTQSTNYDGAAQLIEQYEVGGLVPVYYNPTKQTESVLQPGIQKSYYLIIFTPLVCLFFGLWFGKKYWQLRS